MFTITNEENNTDIVNDIFQFDCVIFDITAGNDAFTRSKTPTGLLLFCIFLGIANINPPRGMNAAVNNVPTTIGHMDVCNNELQTMVACLIIG